MSTRQLPWQCPQLQEAPTPPSSRKHTAQVMDPLVTTPSANKVAKTLEAVIPAIVHRENRPELGAAPEQEAQVKATNIGETTLITSSGKEKVSDTF